jgi:hypothetical protein
VVPKTRFAGRRRPVLRSPDQIGTEGGREDAENLDKGRASASLPRRLHSFRNVRCLAIAAFVAWSVFHAAAHDEDAIIVGTGAAKQIKFDDGFPQPFVVPASIFPGFPGYASGEIAFHSTILDEPTNDFFQFSTNGDFRFVLVAKDPGIEIWGGFSYMTIGESYFVGPSPFDVHPIWNIVNGTPGNLYSLTVRFYDTNGFYADSDPLVLTFTPELPLGPFKIHIALAGPDVSLLWSSNAIGWQLQSAMSFPTTNWNTITNHTDTVGTNFSLSLPTTGTQQFFRLLRPAND